MVKLSDWMSSAAIKTKTISQLVLPGTHDSGAFKLSQAWTPRVEKDFCGKEVSIPIGVASHLKPIKNWTVTQEHNILEQLEHGVRLLDFRISYVENAFAKDGFALTHTFGCCGYEKALDQIVKFLSEHPTEVVVIAACNDSAHKEKMKSHQAELIEITKEKLKGKLAPVDEHSKRIEELAGKIIFLYDEKVTDPEGLIKTEDSYKDLWPNTQKANEINWEITAKIENITGDKINFASYVLTPNASFIRSHLLSSIEGQSTSLANPLKEFLAHVTKYRAGGDDKYLAFNGLTLDFPTDEMIESIIKLNGEVTDLS